MMCHPNECQYVSGYASQGRAWRVRVVIEAGPAYSFVRNFHGAIASQHGKNTF